MESAPQASNLQSLEWQALLRHYSVHCQSAPAKLAAEEILPAETRAEAERLLALTAEAMVVREESSFGSLGALDVLDPSLERVAKQAVLDGRELLAMARLSEITRELKAGLQTKEALAKCPLLSGEATLLPELGHVSGPIRRAIDDDGKVKDSASPTLRSLRDQERRLHSEARDRLDAVLQQAFRDGYLQDKFHDFRDGRYLIPVKSEARNRVPGYVVESSATRATVFMEPAAVRDVNDRIKQTELLIEEETYKIVSQLSLALHPVAAELRIAYEAAVRIDLDLARGDFAGRFAEIRGVSRPEFADHFFLDDLYHPLLGFVLKPDRIIRNTFRLGPDKRVLVISGPNTGGKTVLLKAVGLAALMARAGFFLPCAGEARVPFLRNVLAQIGDAQNLELSLSSFSGSILHLKDILSSAEEDSLVLVDEILHATDPDEATALSRAILSNLQKRGAFAIVTTHLNGLKVKDAFESASMEFDPEMLSPTYRLRMGVPGSSRALEIGLKLGLEPALVDEARSYLSVERVREQSAVDQLEARERELQAAKEELLRTQETLRAEQEQLHSLNDELAHLKKRFKAEALEKLKQQQSAALAEVDRVATTYRKRLSSVQDKSAAAEEAREEKERLRENFQQIEKSLEELAPTPNVPEKEPTPEEIRATQFQKNEPVRILSMGSQGILLSDPGQRNKAAEVMVGNLRMRIPWDNLEPRGRAKPKPGSRPYATSSDHSSVPSELNLVGKRADEAESLLASYIDRASRSGKPFVRIVHGHGSGTIKKLVRDALRSTAYDLKYRPGTKDEGGEGCTVVEFI
jgi:DNA mismatch repair protein MutS2